MRPLRIEALDGRPAPVLQGGGPVLTKAPWPGWIDTSGAEHAAEGRSALESRDDRWVLSVTGGPVECTLTAWIDPRSGDAVFRAAARSEREDLAGTVVHLGLAADAEVTLPALNGMRLTAANNVLPDFVFPWPTYWNAAMLLAARAGGGLMLHAEDRLERPKGLHTSRTEEAAWLGLRTEEEPPFAGRRASEGVEYRLSAWAGDGWDDRAIERYQAWMREARGAPNPPAWIRERLHLYTTHTAHDLDLLEAIAAAAPPAGTLVHLGDWRTSRYDCDYPEYAPKPDLAAFVARAHELGLKVQPHLNAWGVDETSPLLAELDDIRIRDAFTGEPQRWQGYEMPDGSVIGRIAYVHPGSRRWRDLMLDRIRDLLREIPFDSIYLDQSFHGQNQARVDGLTVAQGMAALQAEVRELCPIVGGENVNEVIVGAQCLGHLGVLGFFPGAGWHIPAEQIIELSCDISDRLFGPWHLGGGHMPFDPPHGGGLPVVQCYGRMRTVPAIPHPSVEAFRDPSPALRTVLEAARAGRRLGAEVTVA